MKKVLSLVLVVALVLSSMTFAFAAKFSDVTGDYTTAVEALSALGVVDGYTDGTFKPANSITRAEVAKLVVEALGYKDLVSGSKANFSDTQGHWADGHLALATGLGLTAGYPDGTFKPDQTVSYDEVYTMVVRALGYTDASLKGTWPTNYKVKAIDLGLTADVVMNKALADRGGVAQVIYNALEKELVEVSDENVATPVKTGALTLIDKIASYDPAFEVDANKLDKDHDSYAGNLVDLAPYMYQSLQVYVNDDDEVVYIKDTNSVVVTGTIDITQNVYVNNTDVPVKQADGTIVEVPFSTSTATSLFYNGAVVVTNFAMNTIKTMNSTPYQSIEKITIVAQTDDGDDEIEAGEITGVIITQQTDARLIANVYKTGRDNIDGYNLPVDSNGKVDLDNITVTGAASSLEEIKEYDVVTIYEAKAPSTTADDDYVRLVVARNTATGKVTRVDTYNNLVYINGAKHSVVKVGNVYAAVGTTGATTLNVDNEGTFYLDFANRVVDFEETAGTADNYAVVVAVGAGKITSSGAIDATFEIDYLPAIKLATANDEAVIYDVYVTIDDETKLVDESAEDEDGNELVVTDTTALTLNLTGSALDLGDGDIVKYTLNSNGQIEVLEKVAKSTLTLVDTESANFDLADGAIIFEATTNFPIAKASDLADKISGFGVYNDNGELEVIITANVDGVADDTTIAVVKATAEVNAATNAAGDDVQVATVYMNGKKQEVVTDEDTTFGTFTAITTAPAIFALEFDGNIVVGVVNKTVSATAITVQDISTSTNKIKFDDVWYVIADDATMIDITTGTTNYEFIDIYDLDDSDVIKVIVEDGEVTYIGGVNLTAAQNPK